MSSSSSCRTAANFDRTRVTPCCFPILGSPASVVAARGWTPDRDCMFPIFGDRRDQGLNRPPADEPSTIQCASKRVTPFLGGHA